MLNVSQATSMLQSLGVSNSMATKAAERVSQSSSDGDALNFLKELQHTLKELSSATAQASSMGSTSTTKPASLPSTVSLAKDDKAATDANTTKAPFGSFEEFREWEKGLGSSFAQDYKAPDYIRLIRLSLEGGDSDAFKRYTFFKNNPQYAVDYESIRNGNLSKFPTDGSTLVKSDLSKMNSETAAFYKKNPDQLLAAEGFSMDPTLLKNRMEGDTAGIGDPDWLTQHRWTADGVVANNNRVTYAQSAFIGLDGKGADNYRLAKYDSATGMLIDLDGQAYDPITGQAAA